MTSTTRRLSPWVWEELDIGLRFEPQKFAITQGDVAQWQEHFGVENTGTPSVRALLVPLMMRAFITASAPRPAGNIHVSQELKFFPHKPRPDENLVFNYKVADRVERKGRGWVDIDVSCRTEEGDEPVMDGKMVLIWAGRRSQVEAKNA